MWEKAPVVCRLDAGRPDACRALTSSWRGPAAHKIERRLEPCPCAAPRRLGSYARLTDMQLCPHCGEPLETYVDPGGGGRQDYVEDCAVCCRPIRFVAVLGDDGEYSVEVSAEI